MKIGNLLVNAAYLGEKVLTAIAVGATKVWEGVSKYIKFKDPVVESLCMKWSSDGIGLTPEDAAKVKDIGTTFQGNTEITSFDELEMFGIKSLTMSAFHNCSSLRSVKWPKGISLGAYAFENTGLQGMLDFSDITNTDFPYRLCYHCTSIEEVIIGEKVIRIGLSSVGSSFEGCTSLRKVEIRGNSLKELYYTFSGCSNLETIIMPKTVEIFNDSFNGCNKLTIDADALCSAKVIDGGAFTGVAISGDINCPNLETLSRGAFMNGKITRVVNLGNITELGGGSAYVPFYNCKTLEHVHLPSTLTNIASWTFRNNTSLLEVVVDAITPPTLGTDAFEGTPSTMSIYVPDESVEAYKSATNWSAYADRIKPMSEYQPTTE